MLASILLQGGCPYEQACPSLGAADPESRYHSKAAQDLHYPQADEAIRKSSTVRALEERHSKFHATAIYMDQQLPTCLTATCHGA